ncbi:MAG: hypothetical protein AAF713_05175 [Pseudomonadota bacterium]
MSRTIIGRVGLSLFALLPLDGCVVATAVETAADVTITAVGTAAKVTATAIDTTVDAASAAAGAVLPDGDGADPPAEPD